ncbi:MAG: hypothetical protein CMH83_02335 [Nocardioides sp.]|nr:hypothetical protein [Nocardioides sp.]
MSAVEVWRSFPHDPREPAHAALRASDADRDLVLGVLSRAYGEGRLDRDEHDERASAVTTARTLGDLPVLIADLVPATEPTQSLRRQAEEAWVERRRTSVIGFLAPNIICWAIYLAVSLGAGSYGFPWPLVVTAVTTVAAMRSLTGREEFLRAEVRRLEKQQARELKKRRRGPGMLGPGRG